MSVNPSKRPLFSSRLAGILTMIGVAVGLGNVWRFPYMMGQYGGSAFLFVYLLFTLLFAVPGLMAETALGRYTRKGPLGAFQRLWGAKVGKMIGYLLVCTVLAASSYYVVVIANVLFTAWFSATKGFDQENFSLFEALLNRGWLQYCISIGILVLSLWVVHRGLKRGIERISKLFVPFFLLVMLYLIGQALSLPDARGQIWSFLQPDFGAMKAKHVFAALGQAIYSLSLGGTFMLMYGSYLQTHTSIPKMALFTSIGDVGAALLASLFIVPTVLVFGLDIAAGPQLIFSTLPHLFDQIPAGQWIGTLFMLALGMVAILSLIGAFEVAVGSLREEPFFAGRRNVLIIGIGMVEILLALPSALDARLIGVLDLIFGSGMQLLGCGFAVVALSWGLGKTQLFETLFGRKTPFWQQGMYLWLRWVIPLVLFLVLIGYLYDSFA